MWCACTYYVVVDRTIYSILLSFFFLRLFISPSIHLYLSDWRVRAWDSLIHCWCYSLRINEYCCTEMCVCGSINETIPCSNSFINKYKYSLFTHKMFVFVVYTLISSDTHIMYAILIHLKIQLNYCFVFGFFFLFHKPFCAHHSTQMFHVECVRVFERTNERTPIKFNINEIKNSNLSMDQRWRWLHKISNSNLRIFPEVVNKPIITCNSKLVVAACVHIIQLNIHTVETWCLANIKLY